MVVRLANKFRVTAGKKHNDNFSFGQVLEENKYLPVNAKLLAWGIFLIFFIENGTLGLIPKQFYYVYRNMRISDFLMYGLSAYALFNVKEYRKLYYSKLLIIPKLLLVYFIFQFIISSIKYDYNIVEFFFRLKNLWMSFLIFPFLLLLKRKGLNYLIRIILPVAIISNLLYILSSITGIAFLPDIGISEQNLPGGLKVFRVFGGTFYGELFFMGFIYQWVTKRFRMYQLFLAILFIIPHILAFGRAAWLYLTVTILLILVWYAVKKKEFRLAFKQIAVLSVLVAGLFYAFTQFIPQSDYLIDAIGVRVEQGQDDYKYKEGTYGTRLANITALLNLWRNGNFFTGIGMHPLWVLKPETVEESIIAWGFSDVGWASVLTAYGLIGFLLAAIFQIYYFILALKVLKRSVYSDILVYFIIIFLSKLFFDSAINYSYSGLTVGLMGFYSVAFYIAVITYKYEYIDEDYLLSSKIKD
ncbi:MAG: O-antigen ligase family protein [Ignavibacteria bacterium]